MRGSANWQVQQVFAVVNCIGQSKHEAKEEARAGGAETWAQVGAKIGVYSYATADAYRDTWRHVLEHARSEYGVKDLERLTGEHVVSYLESKIDDGVARATFDRYAAACAKLEQALNKFAEQKESGRAYAFDLQRVRALAVSELGARTEVSRAYRDPDRLVAAVQGEPHILAAAMQRESGARVKEVSLIKHEQLRGLRTDRVTGQLKGCVEVQGKGGKMREVAMRPETYQRLEAFIAAHNGRFEIDGDRYRADLKQAAGVTRQRYEGSHGLRWSWAQGRHDQLQRHGMTYEQSLAHVSREMGHERADITEHYLR